MASQTPGKVVFEVGKSSSIPALVLIGLALGTGSLTNIMAFEIGEPFPLLLLPSLEDGHPMSVADFRGQKLVLHVWAAW